MMKRSVRGMAKVSVLWTIVFLVAFLVAGVAFFLASGELENQTQRADRAEKQVAEQQKTIAEKSEQIVAISGLVGFGDSQRGNNTDVETLKKGLAEIKGWYADLPASAKTIQDVIPTIQQTITSQAQRIKDLEADAAAKATANEELQKAMREAGDKASTEAADLRRQVADAEQQKTEMQADYERRLTELTEQVKDRDAKWRQAEAQLADNQRAFATESEGMRSRMNELGRKLNPFVKEPEQADGKVLTVSKTLNLGWINLGGRNRLPVGTRFTVAAANGGRVKATAEVTKVEGEMSEVQFQDQRDPYDPPSSGDIVFNRVYDPTGDRNAVLVGSFTGAYGKDQLQRLLSGMGVHIQKSLDKSTDLLIVGSESYTDENGQPVESPIQPTDLPIYKEAVAQGVQVVLMKDLRNYFRF